MKFSIITISYNSEKTIYNTLVSVKNQSYKNIEHIIVDGGSYDKTLEIVNKFNHISKIISEKDKGIYDAFNKGINIATGDIVGFLNSDDKFISENTIDYISKKFNDDIECVHGDLIYTNLNRRVVRKWKGTEFQSRSFEKSWMPAHPTFYCRKIVYENLGLYKSHYKIAGDFELMLRFIQKNKIKSRYINKTIVEMKVGGISNSGIKNKLIILKEEFKAFKENEIKINKLKYMIYKLKKLKEFIIL